jgi:chemotaxis protein CheC
MQSIQKKLELMTEQAAKNASLALSRLTGESVSVIISGIGIETVQKNLLKNIEPETAAVGICMPITGELKGSSLLLFSKDIAYELTDLLFQRNLPFTKRDFSELDKSALKEVANIICSSFITVFADALKIKVTEHIPSISYDMYGAIIDQVIADFSTEKGLVMEIKFDFKRSSVQGHVMLVFGIKEVEVIIKALQTNDNI